MEKAPGNAFENGAKVYEMFVKSARSDLLRVGTHYCISSIFNEYPEDVEIYCYTAKNKLYKKIEVGMLKLAMGKVNIISNITWEEKAFSFAVLHLGDQNINAGLKDFAGDKDLSIMQDELKKGFEKGDIPEVVRLMDKYFDGNIFSLWHLFKDEQKKILDSIFQLQYEGVEAAYRQIYESNYTIMNFYYSLRKYLPRPFLVAAEYILNVDIKKVFEEEALDVEKLRKLINEAEKWRIKIDTTTIGFVVSSWVNFIMKRLYQQPEDLQLFEKIDNTLEVLRPLSLSLDLWKAQNKYFSIGKNSYNTMKEKAANGDSLAKSWIESFFKLGNYLNVLTGLIEEEMWKKEGNTLWEEILLHITSLPSSYGIGDLGPGAYRFVNFLAETDQIYWQILPLNLTCNDFGNSPYNSFSAFAGNPLLISPELMAEDDILMKTDIEKHPTFSKGRVNYGAVTKYKNKILDLAFEKNKDKLAGNHEFERFCNENSLWLDDCALFISIKKYLNNVDWSKWPEELRDRRESAIKEWEDRLREMILKEKFFQYIFFKQWYSLKNYCKTVKIFR